jgi:hypothetical protein
MDENQAVGGGVLHIRITALTLFAGDIHYLGEDIKIDTHRICAHDWCTQHLCRNKDAR